MEAIGCVERIMALGLRARSEALLPSIAFLLAEVDAVHTWLRRVELFLSRDVGRAGAVIHTSVASLPDLPVAVVRVVVLITDADVARGALECCESNDGRVEIQQWLSRWPFRSGFSLHAGEQAAARGVRAGPQDDPFPAFAGRHSFGVAKTRTKIAVELATRREHSRSGVRAVRASRRESAYPRGVIRACE